MTDWEEKACQLCIGVSGLFYRRERLVSEDKQESADLLNEPIKLLIEDLKFWLLKNG